MTKTSRFQYLQLGRSQSNTADDQQGRGTELSTLFQSPKHSTVVESRPQPLLESSDGDFEPSRQISGALNTGWNPPFLKRTVIAAFALLFAIFIGSLQAIYSISQTRGGIVSSDEDKRYLWTYGPTAVFVVVTALWRQVDYAIKNLQPWAILARGPVAAENSLLLDYQTPFHIVSLWTSLRRRHWIVASTIVVFFLLKVLTIISTGLMGLEVFVKSDVPALITLQDQFDGTNFDASAVDGRSANAVYGHEAYNLRWPNGTNDNYAVQNFILADSNTNASAYSAVTNVFSTGLDCETGKLSFTMGFDHDRENTPVMSFYNTSVSLSDCQIYNGWLDAPDWYYLANDTVPRYGYWGIMQNVTCSNLPTDDPTRERYMLAVAYSKGHGQNNNTMLNSSNVVCKPTYGIQKATVMFDNTNTIKSVIPLDGQPTQINKVSDLDFSRAVISSINQMSPITSGITGTTNLTLQLDNFLELILTGDQNFNPSNLLDEKYLEAQLKLVYSKSAAQVANSYLKTSTVSDDTITGAVSLVQSRLVVRELPTRLMQAISALMLFFCLFILFMLPRGVVPTSPSSIAAVAAILAKSLTLEKQLRDTGRLDMQGLHQVLAHQHYMTTMEDRPEGPTFAIKRTDNHYSTSNPQPQPSQIKWYVPLVLHRISISLTILATLATIIILEVLYQKSQQNVGLGVAYPNSLAKYTWTYIPTLIFALVATLFNCIDFELEFADAYTTLSKGFKDANSTIISNLLRFISLQTTWEAIRYKKIAVAASSFSTLVAPFLTIVVSGLFAALPYTSTQTINIQAMDWFNTIGNLNSTAMKSTFPVPALILESNMSYPQWTYDELALSRITIPDINNQNISGTISVYSPAVRSALYCAPVSQNLWNNVTLSNTNLNVNVSTPDGCGNSGRANSGMIWQTDSIVVPNNSSGYFGKFVHLTQKLPCPQYSIYYGFVDENHKLQNFSIHFCSANLQMLNVTAEYQLPDFSISSQPVIDATTVKNFTTNYDQPIVYGLPQINITGSSDTFDNVFSAVVYGKDGIPAPELTNTTELLNSVSHVYNQYAAQVINGAYRTNLTSIPNNATYIPNILQGTLTDQTTYRLFQSAVSTRILEALLATLAICAIIIILTADVRETLPKPVGSIAAIASLLAGSRMVHPNEGIILPGAEWWSPKDWENSGILNTRLFRMGWWEKEAEMGAWMNEIPTGYMEEGGDDKGKLGRSFRIDVDQRRWGG